MQPEQARHSQIRLLSRRSLLAHIVAQQAPLTFCSCFSGKDKAVSLPVQAGRFRACWNILVLAFFCRRLAQQRNNDSFTCYFAHTLSKELSAFLQSKVCGMWSLCVP